jgi:hypothetical protein
MNTYIVRVTAQSPWTPGMLTALTSIDNDGSRIDYDGRVAFLPPRAVRPIPHDAVYRSGVYHDPRGHRVFLKLSASDATEAIFRIRKVLSSDPLGFERYFPLTFKLVPVVDV